MINRTHSIVAAALPLLLWTAQPVAATASLTCDASDRNLTLELLGNVGSGDGASIQVTGATIRLKPVPGKFEAVEFEAGPSHLAAQWSFGKELRLGLAPDEVRGVSVFLAIIAERAKSGGSDVDRYRGSYVLKVRWPKGETELKGKLKGCEAG